MGWLNNNISMLEWLTLHLLSLKKWLASECPSGAQVGIVLALYYTVKSPAAKSVGELQYGGTAPKFCMFHKGGLLPLPPVEHRKLRSYTSVGFLLQKHRLLAIILAVWEPQTVPTTVRGPGGALRGLSKATDETRRPSLGRTVGPMEWDSSVRVGSGGR